jgi:protein-S-isoprenylcysteine O-methyltransferase Ste14
MESNKSLWQILLGTISGTDQQGSAKRATAAYVVLVLITMIVIVFSIGFYMAINKLCSDEICKIIIGLFPSVLWTLVIFVLILLGLATMENITSLWKAIRGIKEDKKE